MQPQSGADNWPRLVIDDEAVEPYPEEPAAAPRVGRARPISLSLLMPAYNEERTIGQAVTAVLATKFPCPVELIVVDDGSNDATGEILDHIDDRRLRTYRHPRNLGKGAAILTAASVAVG